MSGDIRTDPRAFRRGLLIDVGGKAVPLEQALDDWQRADFEALDGGLQLAAGVTPTYPVKRRAWHERPRGHSKTTDLATVVLWFLLAAVGPRKAYWAAVDRDQGLLVINAIQVLCRLNPALERLLDVGKIAVTNRETGGTLEVLTSDSSSSWGLLPDLVLVDELTHWRDGNGESLWHSLLSASAKKNTSALAVITNAGLGAGESWQWRASEAARTSDAWHFSRLDGPRASWIGVEQLEEQRKFLPAVAFNRVWLNIWSTAAGDALEESDVNASLRDSTALPSSVYAHGQFAPGTAIFVAVDVGIKRDHSAVQGVVADLQRQEVHHFYSQSWAPPPGGKVELAEIEDAICDLACQFPFTNFVVDPWQAEGLIQRLRAQGLRIREYPSTPKNLSNWATSLVAAFTNRQVTLLPDHELKSQLLKLRIQETAYGFRLQAPRDRVHGHCDKAIAFSMACGEAMQAVTCHLPPIDDGLGDCILL